MRTVFVLAALGLMAIGFAVFGLGTGSPVSAADHSIDTGNYYFCDAAHQGQVCETDLAAGDTVTWDVSQGTHHIVQCTDQSFATCSGGFDSGTKSAPSTFTQTFTSAGTVFYRCAFHPAEMMGKLVIAAAETASPTPAVTAAPTVTTAATSTPTSAALPQTGGPAGDAGTSIWMSVSLALGGLLLSGSGAVFAAIKIRK